VQLFQEFNEGVRHESYLKSTSVFGDWQIAAFFLPIPEAVQIYTVEAWHRQGWNGTVSFFEGQVLLGNPLLRRRGIQHCNWHTSFRKAV
jgi:hypothetical protein